MVAADPGAEATSELLDSCLSQLAAALDAAVRPGSGLWDAVDDGPSAADHYGQLGAALALRIRRGAASGQWREPLQAWLDTPLADRGHAPFNRFLLHLLEAQLGSGEEDLRRRLVTERRNCALRARYPSNNWTLLAAVCRLLEAEGEELGRHIERLLADLNRWTTPAGGFIDFPARGARGATPIAYHHKALFLVAVAAHRTRDARLQSRLQRMLAWSAMCWDPGGGHAGGLGRSSHALYGDACLLAALTLLGAAEDAHRDTPAAAMMRAMLQRWMRTGREDGFLPLNPAADDEARRGWDGYMRLSVYNAWAAAILAWARAQDRSLSVPISFDSGSRDAQAGIVRVDGGGLIALVSTRGQPPQAYSVREAELRYAGGVPFHVARGPVVLCPPGVRIDGERLRAQPAHAGWTPIFEGNGMLYALTDFECSTMREDAGKTTIVLEGQPMRLLRAEGRGAWQRALRAFDWRLLDGALGRRSALRRPRLAGLHARLMLSFDRERPLLHYRLVLRKAGDARIRYLNPGGHALATPGLPFERELSLRLATQAQVGVCSQDDLEQVPLEAAIDGVGWCLPAALLPRGESEVGLTLSWDQGVSPLSRRSSSST